MACHVLTLFPLFTGSLRMDSSKAAFWQQLEAIKQVPCRVLMNWPAFFSFGVIDYGVSIVLRTIPNFDGLLGDVINIGLRGFRDVSKQVTWEAVKNSSACK